MQVTGSSQEVSQLWNMTPDQVAQVNLNASNARPFDALCSAAVQVYTNFQS